MRKIGPFSVDIVVSCYIRHLKEGDDGVPFSKLVTAFDGVLSKSGILNSLNTLSQWGIIKTEFGETETGRAGRLYSVAGESSLLVSETYREYWKRIQQEIEKEKKKKHDSK